MAWHVPETLGRGATKHLEIICSASQVCSVLVAVQDGGAQALAVVGLSEDRLGLSRAWHGQLQWTRCKAQLSPPAVPDPPADPGGPILALTDIPKGLWPVESPHWSRGSVGRKEWQRGPAMD